MKQSLDKLDGVFFKQFNAVHKFKKNKLILLPEAKPPGVYYVKSGYVRQYLVSKDGKELTVNILKPDTYFPVIWALNGVTNIYFYESLTDVVLFKAPREEVLKQFEKYPELLYDLTKRTLSGLDGITRIMETLIAGNARRQIVSAVLILAKRFGKTTNKKQVIINIPLTHRLIGTIAGLSREATSRELEKLTKDKIISRKNRNIIIKNWDKLEQESLINSSENIIL